MFTIQVKLQSLKMKKEDGSRLALDESRNLAQAFSEWKQTTVKAQIADELKAQQKRKRQIQKSALHIIVKMFNMKNGLLEEAFDRWFNQKHLQLMHSRSYYALDHHNVMAHVNSAGSVGNQQIHYRQD